jgi:hypothetical protein
MSLLNKPIMPAIMPGSKDIEIRIVEMLDMGDEQLMAEMERSFLLSDERHQRIDETLEEMVQEVDRLLLRIDDMETEPLNDRDERSNAR